MPNYNYTEDEHMFVLSALFDAKRRFSIDIPIGSSCRDMKQVALGLGISPWLTRSLGWVSSGLRNGRQVREAVLAQYPLCSLLFCRW